jgi:hypothetical protein
MREARGDVANAMGGGEGREQRGGFEKGIHTRDSFSLVFETADVAIVFLNCNHILEKVRSFWGAHTRFLPVGTWKKWVLLYQRIACKVWNLDPHNFS